MIDFRYHLVSLVSVFLALAIGVVLGAGPLKGELGDTLTAQVEALRKDKANLQQAVDNRDAEIADRDEVITELTAPVVGRSLVGRSVAIIALPGTDPDDISGLTSLLSTAGATPTGTVTVQPAWSDPAQATRRATLATTLGAQLPTGSPTSGAATVPEDMLAAVLATAVVTPGTGDGTASKALVDAGLISIAGAQATRPDVVVITSTGPQNGAAGTDTAWQSAELEAGQAIVNAVAAAASATVLVGTPAAAADSGLVAVLRKDPDIRRLSTVDGLGAPAAQLGAALAVAAGVGGTFGHYGSAPGALAPVPMVATTGTPTSPTTP